MTFQKITNLFTLWLYNFLELQLVISLMSLPILISWGLGVSYMSPVANIIFTPLLVLFLWISCLFTLCALLHIPCGWLIYILESITNLWYFLLSFSNSTWLVGFSKSYFLISLFFCSLVVLLYLYAKPTTKQAIIILGLLWIMLLSIRYNTQNNFIQKIDNLPMIAMRINQKNYVIDHGALCQKQNLYNHIDYTIMPALIKSAGITNIDTLVLQKPSKKLAIASYQLALQTNIKTIIVTTKNNCYKTLQEKFENSNIKILPLQRSTSLIFSHSSFKEIFLFA